MIMITITQVIIKGRICFWALYGLGLGLQLSMSRQSGKIRITFMTINV